jgi:hypothetical protein
MKMMTMTSTMTTNSTTWTRKKRKTKLIDAALALSVLGSFLSTARETCGAPSFQA